MKRLFFFLPLSVVGALACVGCGAPKVPPSDSGSCAASDAETLGELTRGGILECNLEVRNSSLTTLEAANSLREVPAVFLYGNAQLDDITALNGIEHPFTLSVVQTRLGGPQTLPTMAADASFSETQMTAISSDVATMDGALRVRESAELSAMHFPEITRLGGLELVGLSTLVGLTTAFPNLEEVGGFTIMDCPNVSADEIAAFEGQVVNSGQARHCNNADDETCD